MFILANSMPYCLKKTKGTRIILSCYEEYFGSTESLHRNLIFLNLNHKYKARIYFELKEGKKRN